MGYNGWCHRNCFGFGLGCEVMAILKKASDGMTVIRTDRLKGWALTLLLGAAVAVSILAHFHEPFPGDTSLIQWVQSWRQPAVTTFMESVSLIGKSVVLIGLAALATLILLLTGRRREAIAATGTLVILLLTPLLQWLVNRPRPPADLVGLQSPFRGLGFPSGHAYQSFVVFSFLIFLAGAIIRSAWLRWTVQAVLALLILAIGVSRVYLGAHWPSDILGAYLLGGSFLGLLLRGLQAARAPAAPD